MTSAKISRIPVLMYHEIADPAESSSRLAVAPSAFADQLAYLHDEGWNAISAGALSQIFSDGAGTLPERTVVLSFDDGYEDFYSKAMPLLSKYEFTATLFMTSGWVKEAGPAGPPMLSWAQLSDVARAGIEVGAHSTTHPQLDQLDGEHLHRELFDSKKEIEDHLGMDVPGLAYPFGYSSSVVRRMARKAGYAYSYAVDNRIAAPGSDLFAIPRLTVKRSTTVAEFGRLVGGEATRTLRQDRLLTTGWSVVRQTRRVLRRIELTTEAGQRSEAAEKAVPVRENGA
jgi:peptidoglycan/xylan/chitin deacetylase (PgdA/CDA1 family)